MCILCAISRWSRRIVTMLPWLIIPFIIIWALSQLLPPGFRLEVTSPRLACLAVLLSSLGWYELLLPRLSSWRARRKALMRERKRIEAQEAAKWRKEATRRCRNCLTAYKVQTPGGGRFMCTYCGHVSKRPVLEVPGTFPQPAGPGIAGNSFPGGQQVKGAGMQYYRGPCRTGRNDVGSWPWTTERGDCTWFGNTWPTGAGCLYAVEGGARGARPSTGENTHGGERYKAGQAGQLSSVSFPFILRILSFLKGTWRKLLGLGSPRRDGSAEGSKSCQRGEDLDGFHGSRGEKARRKAKEKRQARLEKELLEAEERKQREEVARMVEERRKQREEKLEIEESEREAAADREREMRRDRETERRKKDKGRERVTEMVRVGSTELEPKDAMVKNKPSPDLNAAKASPKQSTMKGLEICSNAKIPKGLMHDRGLRFRGAKDNSTRLGYSSRIETAKRGQLLTSKALHAQGWGMAEGSQAKGKSGKSATNVPGNLNSSPRSDVVKQLSDNAWKRVPWTNAWVNRNEALIGEGPGMQTGMMSSSDQRLDQNKEGGVNFLGDRELVVKSTMPPAGGMAIQPPIAPPSSHADSLHQLFSTPSIFSPMDLPMDFQNQHRQKLQTEIKTSLLPGTTFFDTPACTTFEPSESSAPHSPSISLQNSIPMQTSLLSPLQATLPVPRDRICLTGMDTPQHLIPQGPLPDSPLKSSPAEIGVASYPVSPSAMPVPDPAIINTLIPSPILKPTKTDDKDDSLPWDLSSISLEDPSESVDDARWQIQDSIQLQEMKVSVSSTWMPNDKLQAQETLQLPLLSTFQSSFDSKTWVTQSTSMLQEQGSLNLSTDEISSATQVSNRKSIWSDFSTFNTTLRGWDDSDINQKTPPEFVDCITQEIMEDPVITADGHSYERTAIEKWLKLHNTSPKTGEVLPPPPGSNGTGVDKTLRPNHILRGQIIDYKERLVRMSNVKGLSFSPLSKDNGGFLKMSGTPSGLSL